MLVEIDSILKPTFEITLFDDFLFACVLLCAFIPVLLVLRPIYWFFFPRQMIIRRQIPPIVVAVEEIVFPRHINVFQGPQRMIQAQ